MLSDARVGIGDGWGAPKVSSFSLVFSDTLSSMTISWAYASCALRPDLGVDWNTRMSRPGPEGSRGIDETHSKCSAARESIMFTMSGGRSLL